MNDHCCECGAAVQLRAQDQDGELQLRVCAANEAHDVDAALVPHSERGLRGWEPGDINQ